MIWPRRRRTPAVYRDVAAVRAILADVAAVRAANSGRVQRSYMAAAPWLEDLAERRAVADRSMPVAYRVTGWDAEAGALIIDRVSPEEDEWERSN